MTSKNRFKKNITVLLLAYAFCVQLTAHDGISIKTQWDNAAGIQIVAANDNEKYKTGYFDFSYPDLTFINQHSKEVTLQELLSDDRPVMLSFIFTSCPTICPVLTSTFAKLQSSLQSQKLDVKLVSVSIDPEHDTPSVLQDYAAKFNANENWTFITGKTQDIVSLQKSFDSFRGDKMSHVPVYFMRAAGSEKWLRIEGFPSIKSIIAEYRRLGSA